MAQTKRDKVIAIKMRAKIGPSIKSLPRATIDDAIKRSSSGKLKISPFTLSALKQEQQNRNIKSMKNTPRRSIRY